MEVVIGEGEMEDVTAVEVRVVALTEAATAEAYGVTGEATTVVEMGGLVVEAHMAKEVAMTEA